MSRRTVLIAVGILAVAGGAVAVAAVGERAQEQRFAQMMGERGGDGMGGMGRGMRGEGRDGMGMGMGQRRMADDEYRGDRGGRGWRGFGRGMSKDEFDARVRERFARIDKNNDGVLDRTEIEAHVGQMGFVGRGGDRAGGPGHILFRRFDANNDGKVTREELAAGVKAMFARMDLDGDGRITDADLPPIMRGQGVLKGEGRMGRFGMMGRLVEADANRDGIITLDEVLAAATRRFEQFDRTKDGTIDQGDRDQLRKEMTEYRVQRYLNRFGATKEGRVTREQFAAASAEMFRMMDANNDGRIDRGDRGMRGPAGGAGPGGRGGPDRGPGQGPGSGR